MLAEKHAGDRAIAGEKVMRCFVHKTIFGSGFGTCNLSHVGEGCEIERFAPDMCQEETPAPKDTPVHPVNGEVHVQDWVDTTRYQK